MNIEDEREIVAVLVRYATAIDRRDWQLFASCFTHNVDADYGSIGRWRDRETLTDFMQKGHSPIGPTLHRLTNFVIVGDSERAQSACYVDALLLRPVPGIAMRQAHGSYEDFLVHEQQGWKIRKRRFLAVFIHDAANPG
jgi:hypothetical protein